MLRSLLIVLVAMSLAACSTQRCDKPHAYQKSRDGRALVVPDDLSRPPPTGVEIPDVDPSAPASRGPCGEVPPSPPIEQAPDAEAAS